MVRVIRVDFLSVEAPSYKIRLTQVTTVPSRMSPGGRFRDRHMVKGNSRERVQFSGTWVLPIHGLVLARGGWGRTCGRQLGCAWSGRDETNWRWPLNWSDR
jgi:hypothetical protein